MKFTKQFVYMSILSVGLTSSAWAQETTESSSEAAETEKLDAGETQTISGQAKALSEYSSGEIEFGAGHVSESSYKFGRYTGLNEEGGYVIGNFNLNFRYGLTDYTNVIGTDLGLDSRNLRLEHGRQGSFDTYIEYDKLPSFNIDSAVTPFDGVGTGNLTLPDSFVVDDPTSFEDQKLTTETERERIEGGFSFVPKQHWKIGLSASQETKQGTDIIGGALAGSLSAAPVGNTVAVLLPEPIDYETNKMNLGVDYVDKQMQWRLAYQMSLFRNKQQSLTWESPFFDDGSRSTIGRLALPPDNQFHQLSLSGAYAITPTTRITGLLSHGVMTQDEDFQPYTINPAIDEQRTLPTDSLEGDVILTSARLAVTSRPLRPLRLKASYKYDERNNNTPQNQYDYYVLDTETNQQRSAINEPVSYKKHLLDLSGKYRFNRYVDGLLGYEYKKIERDEPEFTDVEENEENKYRAEVKVSPMSELDVTLKAAHMQRDASDYEAELPTQNDFLRKYYLAEVDQDSVGMSLFYAPNQFFNLVLRGDLIKEDYTDSKLGLTESERPTYGIDLNLLPTKDINLYAFYTREDYDTKQAGAQPGTTVLNWQADIEDKVDTYGAGIKFTGIRDRIDLGADLVYAKAESDIMMANDSPDVATVPYPTLSNELRSYKLYALYHFKRELAVKLSFLHEEYESTDWALDGADTDSAQNMILLGNESPDYDVDLIMASLLFRF